MEAQPVGGSHGGSRISPARTFGDAVPAYETGRPDYPPAAIAWLTRRLVLGPGRTLVDLGAGTGKLTRPMAESGATIVALEPVRPMLARLLEALPGVWGVIAVAEAIPLRDAAADAVTVGHAFQWFNFAPALREIARVLRSGGGLALVWNRPDMTHPAHVAMESVLNRYRRDFAVRVDHRGVDWQQMVADAGSFTDMEHARFKHVHAFNAASLEDFAASISFIAALPPSVRAVACREIVGQIQWPGREVALPFISDVYFASAIERK
jgi:ubiquinone/menaquinone biosynthesis C-methylase UbiE